MTVFDGVYFPPQYSPSANFVPARRLEFTICSFGLVSFSFLALSACSNMPASKKPSTVVKGFVSQRGQCQIRCQRDERRET